MVKISKRWPWILLFVFGGLLLVVGLSLGMVSTVGLSLVFRAHFYWWISILIVILGIILFIVGLRRINYYDWMKEIQRSSVKSAQDIVKSQIRDLEIEKQQPIEDKQTITGKNMPKTEKILEQQVEEYDKVINHLKKML